MDAQAPGGYLEAMILLSEAAEKIRNEVRSWPGWKGSEPVIRCRENLADAREGDERLLTEVLGITIGLLSSAATAPELQLSGDNLKVVVSTGFPGMFRRFKLSDWDSLRRKAGDWSPEIRMDKDQLEITFVLPACPIDPPVDLQAMAEETGISPDDAGAVLEGFLENGRTHLDILLAGNRQDREAEHRAAHSLKGSGKTLRAPELAAAARKVEKCLRDHSDTGEHLVKLEEAWNRIEHWHEEVRG